jgi:hypothetical protein
MVIQQPGRSYSYSDEGMRRARVTAVAWLVFYALAVVVSIIALYSEVGVEVATMTGVGP